jgi:hypothetical protein
MKESAKKYLALHKPVLIMVSDAEFAQLERIMQKKKRQNRSKFLREIIFPILDAMEEELSSRSEDADAKDQTKRIEQGDETR